jgi:Interferon-induced transmembrane protein
LAIVSIVFAVQVHGKWAIGDVAGARAASENARNFAIWSLGAWVIVLVLWVLIRLGLAMSTGFWR